MQIPAIVFWKKNFMSILHCFNIPRAKKFFFQILAKYGGFLWTTILGVPKNVFDVFLAKEP